MRETVKHVSELDLHEAHWLLCHSVEGEACPDGCDKAAYPEELRRYQSDGPVYVDIRVYWDWCFAHGYPLPVGIVPSGTHPLSAALSRSAWALFDGIRAAVRATAPRDFDSAEAARDFLAEPEGRE